MLDSLKSTLFASLGAVSLAQEKLKATIDDLVQRGELTRDQGTKVVTRLIEKGEEDSREFGDRVVHELSRLIDKTPLVSREELSALQARVRTLEERLGVASDAQDAPDIVEPAEEL